MLSSSSANFFFWILLGLDIFDYFSGSFFLLSYEIASFFFTKLVFSGPFDYFMGFFSVYYLIPDFFITFESYFYLGFTYSGLLFMVLPVILFGALFYAPFYPIFFPSSFFTGGFAGFCYFLFFT